MESQFPYQINNFTHLQLPCFDSQSDLESYESLSLDESISLGEPNQTITLITKSPTVSYLFDSQTHLIPNKNPSATTNETHLPVIQYLGTAERLETMECLGTMECLENVESPNKSMSYLESNVDSYESLSLDESISPDEQNQTITKSPTISDIFETPSPENTKHSPENTKHSPENTKHSPENTNITRPISESTEIGGERGRGLSPYMCGDPQLLKPPDRTDYQRTVIFDLDETLICTDFTDQSNYQVYLRPHLTDLLRELTNLNCEIIVWSAGVESHVKKCLNLIDPSQTFIKMAIYRDSSWFKGIPIFKPIKLIPHRDPEKIILIENNPHAAYQQLRKTIIVTSYLIPRPNDQLLKQLTDWFKQHFTEPNPENAIPLESLDKLDLKWGSTRGSAPPPFTPSSSTPCSPPFTPSSSTPCSPPFTPSSSTPCSPPSASADRSHSASADRSHSTSSLANRTTSYLAEGSHTLRALATHSQLPTQRCFYPTNPVWCPSSNSLPSSTKPSVINICYYYMDECLS